MLRGCILLWSLAFGTIVLVSTHRCPGTQRDLVILLDSSGSIRQYDFELAKRFLATFINDLDISEAAYQVAVIRFSDGVRREAKLDEYNGRKADLIQKILSIRQNGGGTEIAKAIEFTLRRILNKKNRAGAQDQILVLTDGFDDDVMDAARQVDVARAQNVEIIAVGVGENVNDTQLWNLASRSELMFKVDTYADLTNIQSQLVGSSCGGCHGIQRDLVILFDTSGSVSSTDFEIAKRFLASFINELDISENAYQVAVVRFSDGVRREAKLGEYNNMKADLMQKVLSMRQSGGGRRTAQALAFALRRILSVSNRRDAVDQILILTDGKSDDERATARQVQAARSQNVQMISVGVGENVSDTELWNLASSAELMFKVDRYADLTNIQSQLVGSSCGAPSTAPSTTTIAPLLLTRDLRRRVDEELLENAAPSDGMFTYSPTQTSESTPTMDESTSVDEYTTSSSPYYTESEPASSDECSESCNKCGCRGDLYELRRQKLRLEIECLELEKEVLKAKLRKLETEL